MSVRFICFSVVLTWMLLAMLGTSPADAQSIWKHRRPGQVNLIGDTAARRVGDLLTILVSESTDVDNTDQRSLDKQSSDQFRFSFNSTGNEGGSTGTYTASNSSDRDFDGNSQFTVEREFTDRITAHVVDVLPNGHLVIAGRRRQVVAGEVRTLLVSGTVREADITPNNTVESQFVGNFKVCYEGDGPETHFSNQGWGSRIINRLWPW